MQRPQTQLALYSDSDSRWIAGILYAQAVARAVQTLPSEQRPDVHLMVAEKADGSDYQNLRQLANTTTAFNRTHDQPVHKAMIGRIKTFVGRKPRRQTLPSCIESRQANVLFPCRISLGADFPVPWIGWIPDFQHKHLPELFTTEELRQRDHQFQQLVDDSAHLVVSSQDAYKDLLRFYRAAPEHVSVYPFRTHADPSWFEESPIETARKHDLPDKFLMFPSQFWQHKNHLMLLKAILLVAQKSHPHICLVLSGKDADYRNPEYPDLVKRFIRDNNLEANVRYVGFLPRKDQVGLMRRSCAIVQPSLFEGWSMLVEDCRTLGKDIFLSDLAVHQEQAYKKTRYFDRHCPDSLASQLEAEWPSLLPGPDIEAEATAKLENETLEAESGRLLSRIFELARKAAIIN